MTELLTHGGDYTPVIAGFAAAPLTVVGAVLTFAGWVTSRLSRRFPIRPDVED